MPKKLDLTENLEKYIIDHSESLTHVQKEIILSEHESKILNDQ